MYGQFCSGLQAVLRSVTKHTRRTVAFTKPLVVSVGLVAASLTPVITFTGTAHADTSCSPDGIVSGGSGSSWLGGGGVNVCYNGGNPANDFGDSCYTLAGGPGGENCGSGTVYAGEEWQCVELVNRLYLTKGWINSTWSGSGNTIKNNISGHPGLTEQDDGSISYLNPGDVITFTYSTDGHAGIINSVGSTIDIINQNTSSQSDLHSSGHLASGTSFSAGNADIDMTGWAGYDVQAVIHHPNATNSRPAAVTRGSGNMDVFYRDTSATPQLINIGWNSGTGWGSATSKASGMSSNPTAVARTTDSMDVFYRDTSNNLQNVGWTSSGGWGAATGRVTDGSVYGDPFVISLDSNHMDVFYKDSSSRLVDERWNSSTGWASPLVVITQSVVAGSPSGVALDSTHFHVFYRDTSNNMQDVSYSAGTWGGPNTRVSGSATGDFSVAARDSNDMDIFYQTSSGGLGDEGWNATNGWSNQTWSGTNVTPSGGSMVGNPYVIVRDSGNMSVFYQDNSVDLIEKGWNWQTGWSAPNNRANSAADNPAGVSRDSGDMDIFFRDGGSNLNDAGWNSSTGWSVSKPGAGSMA